MSSNTVQDPATEVGAAIGAVFSMSAVQDPFPAYAVVRETAPAVAAPGPGGVPAWHVARHAEVAQLYRDRRMSARRPLGGPGVPGGPTAPTMLTEDPPEHTRLRKLVSRAFTVRSVAARRPAVQAILDDLLEGLEGGGTADFMEAVAYPFPLRVFADVLGVPGDDWELFRDLSHGAITFDPAGAAERGVRMAHLEDYLRVMVDRRRAEPRDDLLTGLVQAHDEHDALTEDEIVAQAVMMLVAAYETTTGALGSALVTLRGDPWSELRARPDLVRPAIAEVLRLQSPFQIGSRVAATDVPLGDRVIPAGSFVFLWIAAANRDPRVYGDPDTVRLDRAAAGEPGHLAFAGGIHYCLGAALAELELEVALTTMTRRYPDLRINTSAPTWSVNPVLRTLSALPVDLGAPHRTQR